MTQCYYVDHATLGWRLSRAFEFLSFALLVLCIYAHNHKLIYLYNSLIAYLLPLCIRIQTTLGSVHIFIPLPTKIQKRANKAQTHLNVLIYLCFFSVFFYVEFSYSWYGYFTGWILHTGFGNTGIMPWRDESSLPVRLYMSTWTSLQFLRYRSEILHTFLCSQEAVPLSENYSIYLVAIQTGRLNLSRCTSIKNFFIW